MEAVRWQMAVGHWKDTENGESLAVETIGQRYAGTSKKPCENNHRFEIISVDSSPAPLTKYKDIRAREKENTAEFIEIDKPYETLERVQKKVKDKK